MATSSAKLGGPARRDVLRAGVYGLGLGVVGWGATPLLGSATPAAAADGERILVVVELSGANDGLNTVVPFADDVYYRARPNLGIRASKLRKLDEHFGLQPTLAGFERLYKDGHLAIVHGVGYDHPSFSHFSSMAYWHTGAPNSGDAFGWLGRLADGMDKRGIANFLVDIESHQSLAVRARNHVPLVFDNPEKFTRRRLFEEQSALAKLAGARSARNPSEGFLFDVAASAQNAEVHVREACAAYRTPMDYGLFKFGLERVAALISAGFPTRIYYVAYPNNAFDTHVAQADTHARILTYTSDHIAAFIADNGADWSRRRCGGDGVQRVRPPRRRERQSRHRPRHRGPRLRRWPEGARRPLRRHAELDRSRRRQHALHDGFPPPLRDHDPLLDGLFRRARSAQGRIRPARHFSRACVRTMRRFRAVCCCPRDKGVCRGKNPS